MAKIKILSGDTYESCQFKCPGCGHDHAYQTKNTEYPNTPLWKFNGDVNNPTFTPSLLIRWGTYADPNWEIPEGAQPSHKWSGICHLYVTNGQIQYLGDCTHHLAGQTIPMQEID